MNNKIIKIIGLFFVLALFTGCQDWFDINTDPVSPNSVPIDQSMPLFVFMASQLTYDHVEYGMWLSQCLTTGGKSQTGNLPYKQGWEFISNLNRNPQWRRHYIDIGINIKEALVIADREDIRNVQLIGRTLILYSTQLTTDMFGDMPRKEAYKSSKPPYDTQESIYEWMHQEADDLIQLYADPAWTANPNNLSISKRMDRIFEGNLDKWGLFVKMIKARLLLRKLPNWDNTPETCQAIITLVDEILNDPNYSDVLYKYDGGTLSEQNCPFGPARPLLNLGWTQARSNELNLAIPSRFFLYGMLGAYNREYNYISTRGYALDPRALKFMNPITSKSLKYLDNNIGMAVSETLTNDYPSLYGDNPFTKNDGYVLLFGKEELLFMKAEAQYWARDKVGAYETWVKAIEANFDRLDPGRTVVTAANYTRFWNIRLVGETNFTIAELMQQKYIAMYLQPEQWTDMRRYNYSSKTNGIRYDGEYVYTIKKCYSGTPTYQQPGAAQFTAEFNLTRPYNLYAPYWIDDPGCYGVNAKLSPNAWITRVNYDPETEELYNKEELERLGAYKNHEWLKKRMIWAYKNNDYVDCSDPNIEWK